MAKPKETVYINVHGKQVAVYSAEQLLPTIAEVESAAVGQAIIGTATETLAAVTIGGDITIAADGTASIGAGKVTVDMIDSTLLKYLVSVARVGYAHVGYCKVG